MARDFEHVKRLLDNAEASLNESPAYKNDGNLWAAVDQLRDAVALLVSVLDKEENVGS